MRKSKIAGVIVTGIYFLVSIFLLIQVWGLGMVPTKYFAVLAAALLIIGLVLRVLMDSTRKHKVRFIVGLILAIVMIAGMGTGMFYLSRTRSAVDNITNIRTESSAVGIYVKAENETAFQDGAQDYQYGILRDLDRVNTNEALKAFAADLGSTPRYAEYDSLPALMDALLNGQVQAIVLNSAYIPALEEIEGYEDIAERIVEVAITRVETTIPVTPQRPEGNPTDPTDTPPLPTEVPKNENVFVMYMSGIDTFGKITNKSRSDVNILAAVNTETHQILLISTPRDFYVPLSISNGNPDKLTHAGIYGINVSMETLEMLYGIDVDYYFRVNFTGFKNIIDALGGVTVDSDRGFTSFGFTFNKGINHLNGEEALAFARNRKSFAEGDRARGRHQMEVIRGVVNKLISRDMLMNYLDVLAAVEGSFETSMPYDKISELVKAQLESNPEWNVVSYSVDGTGASKIPWTQGVYAYVMIPDPDTIATAQSLLTQLYDGQVPTLPEN